MASSSSVSGSGPGPASDDKSQTSLNDKLLEAAKDGDITSVESLLSQGADVNPDYSWLHETPLSAAVIKGHYDIVQLLLSKGADVDSAGVNALAAAASGGHCDIVKLLLSEGADPNAEVGEGDTALSAAAGRGHYDIIQLLLSKGADVNNKGGYALYLAAAKGHYDVVQLLLSKGVNAKDEDGVNALVAAAYGGHCDIVKLLLSEGADPNAEDWGRDQALSVAAEEGHYDIVQLLLSKGADVNNDGGNALVRATRGGHCDIVKLLLSEGADPNAEDVNGYTALDAAVEGGHYDIVQLLLSKGADVNNGGGFALSLAAEIGHYDTVQLLLSKGANTKDKNEFNALVSAAYGGHCDIVKLLLSEGADPNVEDMAGDNALSAAARGGHYDIVQLLISKGADVNTRGDALSAAARGGHYDIVQLLLSKGANVDIGGGRALIAAAKDGKHNILQLLLSKGVDVNTGEGKALSVAAGGGHYDSVLLLLSKGGASVDSYCQAAIDEAIRNSHNDIAQLLRNHISSSQSHLQQQSFMSKASSSSLPIYSTSLTSPVLQSPSYQYLPTPGVAPQPQLSFNYSPVMQPQPIYPNYYGQPSPYIPQSTFRPQFSYAQSTLLPNTQFTQSRQGTSGGMHQQFGVQQQFATQYAAATPFYTERMEYSTLAQPLLSTTESQDPTLPSTSIGIKQDSNTCDNGTAVKERLEELQCYLPQLSNMIERLKHRGPSNELSKLITLYNVILSKNMKISMSTLEKCHIVLRNIFPENSSNDVRDKISTCNTFKEIDQRYLQKAMKDGLVESSVTKAVVQGEARVGKSSLKCLLVSKRYTDDTSTSCIESPCIAVRCFGHTGKYWEEIDEEEMGIKVIAAVQSDAVKKSESNIEEMDLEHANSKSAKKNSSKTTKKVIQQEGGTSSKDGPQNNRSKEDGQSIDTVSDDSSSAAVISHNVPVTIELTRDSNEKDAVVRVRKFYQKCKKNQKKGTSLNGRRWLFFIDSGGQIQFQKLLPAFMPYASVLLLVVSLAKNLSNSASTLMQLPEREINVEQHSLSVIEVLKQLLSAIASSAQQYRSLIAEDPLLSKCITPPTDKLQVLPVATHRDEFDKESMESIDDKRKQLNEVFKLHSTCEIIGQEGRIFLHEIDGREARLDSHNKLSNPSLEKIVKTLDDNAYQIKVPLKWYCFGVLLYDVAKEGCGVLSLSYCQKLGEQLKVGLSPEESLSAIKFLSFLNKLLYYPESPASDLVFVNLESLIDILRDLVIFVSDARSDVTYLLPTHKALVCHGQLSIKILKAASKHCGEISKLFPDFETKLLGLFEYLLIAAKMPDEGCFLMPALLPIKDVSDVNPFPNTIPLLLYFKNTVPMGLFCAVIVHLLSNKESPWIIVGQSNFSNYFTLRHRGYLLGSIILVEQLDCIVLYCEVASDYVAVRDAIEEAVTVAMSKHKLSENEKPVRAFYCSCGRGKRHAAEATWFKPQHRYISTCTIDYKSLDLLSECRGWLFAERKRQHEAVQQLPDLSETRLFHSDIAYHVLVDNTQKIMDYFAEDYCEIADKLLQRKVINKREKNAITDRNTGLSAYQRMEKLLECVKESVKLNVSVFSSFVQTLREKGTLASEKFAEELRKNYEQQCCNIDLESSAKRSK